MIITLIRHLPTEWNKKTWLQGRRDTELSPITKEYQERISRNKQLLGELPPFDIILASTLKRTHQTAKMYGFQAEAEGLLDELDFGPFEGLPKEKLIEKHGEQWFENPKELVFGESIENLENRIRLFLKKYKDYQNLLVFGHGSWIRALICYAQFGDINGMNNISLENNQCTTVMLDLEQVKN
ncbi:histidine phosphatase family protein [Neobacillus jeddahensis]|uniref:histidine phosphatase family protein n=1 Tax=Neobacillus jeddahensis TaxID=1461580 RepID=UPI00058B8B01|nr:histidine phosphatase family protein [Neobacillus jeddahensis]